MVAATTERTSRHACSSSSVHGSVAVVGVPDEKWGEAVKACVVLRAGQTVDAAELVERVRAAKGSVHAPKSIDFVDALPLTPLGKLDKKALRSRYWESADRAVG